MCGIVGVAGGLGWSEDKVFRDLLFMDTLRGKHSTGIVAVQQAGRAEMFKKALPASEFMETQAFAAIMRKANYCIIGHNRYATAGAINSLNAHPFSHGTITGVHNGTLVNQTLLPTWSKYEVDSDNIYHAISTIGVQATVAKLHGAYALVWWDDSDKTLNFLRNEERTLYYAEDMTGTLFWASEKGMLISALDRNDPYDYKVKSVEPNKHYKFKISLGTASASAFTHEPTIEEVSPYVPPKPTTPIMGMNKTHGKTTPIAKQQTVPSILVKGGIKTPFDLKFNLDAETFAGTVPVLEGTSTDMKFGIRVFGVMTLNDEDVKLLMETMNPLTCSRITGCIPSIGKALPTITLYIKDIIRTLKSEVLTLEQPNLFEGQMDHRGTAIGPAKFRKQYTSCNWCLDPLIWGEATVLDATSALCKDCQGAADHTAVN